MRNAQCRERGFSLLESLIAVLLFSFAVIGAAGLQGSLLGLSQNATFRAEAAFYAEQLVGMASVDVANAACYAGGSCINAYTADDVADWLDQVKTKLPEATTYPPLVSFNAATKDFNVTIYWRRPGDDITRNVSVATVIK
jgi:type IV pilus assembly protein PilV